MADYLEKQLAHMKIEHLKARNSDINSFGRHSGLYTNASTMNTTMNGDDENDMPFAIASNSVKHVPKKSLMLAGNNMMSPKSSVANPMRLSQRKGSVTFESKQEDLMRATTISFRN